MCLNFISLRFPLLDCGISLLSPHPAHQPRLPFLRAALQPSSLLQAAVSKHSSEGWAITPADAMLVSSRHKASPTPPCHLCKWDIAGAFQSCQQLSTGSLCPLQLATRLLCLPGPLPASLQSCWLRTLENAQFLNISCVVSKGLEVGVLLCALFSA